MLRPRRPLVIAHRALRSPAFIAALHRRGFSVWCWTVNDPRALRRLALWGADAILTDNPALLQTVLSAPGLPSSVR